MFEVARIYTWVLRIDEAHRTLLLSLNPKVITMEIQFAEDDVVEKFPEIAAEFLQILGLAPDQVFISDESNLSDFSFAGPEELYTGKDAESLKFDELTSLWDGWIIGEIERRFHVVLGSTEVPLCVLFRRIEESRVH